MLMEQLRQTGAGDVQMVDNSSMDLQSASEVLKNISKGGTQDIVILYENIEMDATETSGTGSKPKSSNQYVETVVYNDDTGSECSDISEIYTKEDFHELCMINNETIDFINNIPSIENPLCHKHSNMRLKSSEFTRGRRRQFSFETPYTDYQFKSFNIFGPCLPTSLVHYKCWTRPDDDYNFYMDNLISYVQHTIEQLKRISNGEYLTDKAKQKWRETKIFEKKERQQVTNTILSNTISKEVRAYNKDKSNKVDKKFTTHSEINFMFLNKLLEKRVVLDIPKFMGCSLTLSGKIFDNKLIIQCKKGKKSNNQTEQSQMIVALDLKYPTMPLTRESLQAYSNPNGRELCGSNLLAQVLDNSIDLLTKSGSKLNIVELEDQGIQNNEISLDSEESIHEKAVNNDDIEVKAHDKLDETYFNLMCDTSEKNGGSGTFGETFSHLPIEEKLDLKDGVDYTLSCALQRLNTKSPVHEETEGNIKKKNISPTRVRIKSPYENRSYILDEKKRKRLLEIRERREKRKIAMSKNCKISKNKFGQGSIFPHASSSVTKLSITNKSFYNSIYGHNGNTGSKEGKQKPKKRKNDGILTRDTESYMENLGSNRSLSDSEDNLITDYFKSLDTQEQFATVRETTNMDPDVIEVELGACAVSRIIAQEDNVLSNYQTKQPLKELDENNIDLDEPRYMENLVPSNTQVNLRAQESPKALLSLECRKSIDKLYDLMKELSKPENLESRTTKSDSMSSSVDTLNIDKSEKSIVSSVSLNGSNTNYNVKRIETPSSKNNKSNVEVMTNIAKASVIPKPQIAVKFDEQNIRNLRTSVTSKQFTHNMISDNPLKAISQLIHKFDNVQRHNQKSELKASKKMEDTNKEDKNNSIRMVSSKAAKPDKVLKNNINSKDNRVLTPKENKSPVTKERSQKIFNRFRLHELNKNTEKVNEKKIEDLIDEVKEMRGEAVRGPKQTRLDTLAQPKKLYLDPVYKEHSVNNGRSSLGNRLPRKSQIPQRVNNVLFQNNKPKKTLDLKLHQQQSKNQEEGVASRRSAGNSPERRRLSEKKKVTQTNINSNQILKKKPIVDDTKQIGQILINLTDCSRMAQKSRVPVIPDDFTSQASLISLVDSNSLGTQFHSMVNAMVNSASPPYLTVVDESDESRSISLCELIKNDKTEAFETKSYGSSSVSDFPIDIFEDKHIETAVASTSYSKQVTDKSIIENKESKQLDKFNKRTSSSLTELDKLENALTCHISDTFRNKTMKQNLTPQHSMQQIFVLQSGDDGSVVVKSTISQKCNISNIDIESKILSVQNLTKCFIDWSCNPIPVQCFPVFQSMQYCNPVRHLIPKSYKNSTHSFTTNNSGIENARSLEIYYGRNKETSIKKDENNGEKYTIPSCDKVVLAPEKIVGINLIEVNENVENMSNTTSMDILVGLLNEIKNISTCQSNIKNQNVEENHETIRINEHSLENSYQNQISITTLDKLRKLESHSSLYSYFNSSNDELANDRCEIIRPILNTNEGRLDFMADYGNDQFLSANSGEKQIVHCCTNVPSQPLPISVNQSTSVSTTFTAYNCFVGVNSGGCRQNVTKCDKGCLVTCSNPSSKTAPKNAILDFNMQTNLEELIKTDDKTVTHKDVSKKQVLSAKKKFLKCSDVVNDISKVTDEKIESQLKLKRDILVTVYSMLVLTVFVALTFPGILFV